MRKIRPEPVACLLLVLVGACACKAPSQSVGRPAPGSTPGATARAERAADGEAADGKPADADAPGVDAPGVDAPGEGAAGMGAADKDAAARGAIGGPGLPAALAWSRLAAHAAFPASYNFPVHVAGDGRFIALHPRGTWESRDGVAWAPGSLPWSGMNSAYLSYVSHAGSTWALGTLEGDYRSFRIDPVIRRTSDYSTWEVVGRATTLPQRIFYAAAAFRGALWILGGHDGTRETSDVWRSVDGLEWRQVLPAAPWAPRAGARAVVFRDRLFLIGGGRIDGPAGNDAWSSADGIDWRLETPDIAAEEPVGYLPIVFHDRLWLVGANRSGRFSSEMLVSDDGRSWRAESAPWSPRGGVAAWTDGTSMYVTGGKYSTEAGGETVFQYYNDVWRLGPAESPAGAGR